MNTGMSSQSSIAGVDASGKRVRNTRAHAPRSQGERRKVCNFESISLISSQRRTVSIAEAMETVNWISQRTKRPAATCIRSGLDQILPPLARS